MQGYIHHSLVGFIIFDVTPSNPPGGSTVNHWEVQDSTHNAYILRRWEGGRDAKSARLKKPRLDLLTISNGPENRGRPMGEGDCGEGVGTAHACTRFLRSGFCCGAFSGGCSKKSRSFASGLSNLLHVQLLLKGDIFRLTSVKCHRA